MIKRNTATYLAFSPPSKSRGISLVEVLIASLVLSIGLIGIGSLQVKGLDHSYQAYLRSQAIMQVNEIADRIRANAALAGNYALAVGTTPPSRDCISVACTPTEIAEHDLFVWVDTLSKTLPSASASIVWDGTAANVIVCWNAACTDNAASTLVMEVIPI